MGKIFSGNLSFLDAIYSKKEVDIYNNEGVISFIKNVIIPKFGGTLFYYTSAVIISSLYFYRIERNVIIDKYKTDTGYYPSKAQIWTSGKNAEDVFESAQLQKTYFGDSKAPNGKFIIDVNNENRRHLGVTHKNITYPKTCSFLSGRVFWSGMGNKGVSGYGLRDYSGYIFFSRVLSDIKYAGDCYQEADPTSESISDIIDTDGGYINIQEATNIIKMESLGSQLLIFASNGVWALGGVDGYFKATAYTLDKISDIGVESEKPFCKTTSSVVYATKEGIMLIANDGKYLPQNITKPVLNNFYSKIPDICKKSIKITYDITNSELRFLYSLDVNNPDIYSNEIIFNMNLQAWYKNSFKNENYKLLSCSYLSSAAVGFVNEDIILTDNTVVEDVFVSKVISINKAPTLKYLVKNVVNNTISFASYTDNRFLDFGEDYKSFLITAYLLFNDTQRDKVIDYITTSFRKTETGYVINEEDGLELNNQSSCMLSVRWDFVKDINSVKWSKPFQAYRHIKAYIPNNTELGDSLEVIQTKNKIRGQGKTLSILFESETGKDMHIYGWAISLSGNKYV